MSVEQPGVDKSNDKRITEFGEKLRAIRLRFGLTQPRMAEICGVKRQTISSWESGKTSPDVRALYLLRDWCASQDVPLELGDMLGETRYDWLNTPLGYTINLLQVIDEMGIRGVYYSRAEALAGFCPFIQQASSICVTASSFLGIRAVAHERVSTLLQERAAEVDFSILMTHPDVSKWREKQEGRRSGSIKIEIEETVETLKRWGVKDENIRFYRGAPTVFMIYTPTRMILNPYTYETEGYRTLTLEVAPTGNPNDVFSQYRDNHFRKPWNRGVPVKEILGGKAARKG
jgi:transcriptional regulator with XRE-family HTH domain